MEELKKRRGKLSPPSTYPLGSKPSTIEHNTNDESNSFSSDDSDSQEEEILERKNNNINNNRSASSSSAAAGNDDEYIERKGNKMGMMKRSKQSRFQS